MKTNLKSNLTKLTLAAMFIALDIIVTRLFSIWLVLGIEKVSIQPLVYMFAAYMIGPWYSIAAFCVSDVLGMFLFPQSATFFWIFTVVAAVRAAYYGFALYKKPLKLWYSAAVIFIGIIAIEILLNTYIMSVLYTNSFLYIVSIKFIFKPMFIPLYIFIFYGTMKILLKVPEVKRIINN